MKTTKYLYGCNATDFADMIYKDALVYKIKKAKELLAELVEEHYYARDNERCNYVLNAIQFNEKLLKEIE